jgi:hypothetical protein
LRELLLDFLPFLGIMSPRCADSVSSIADNKIRRQTTEGGGRQTEVRRRRTATLPKSHNEEYLSKMMIFDKISQKEDKKRQDQNLCALQL